jgi:4-amino-4-deoxy-L-arabinose transferase-like glycosyltransferase
MFVNVGATIAMMVLSYFIVYVSWKPLKKKQKKEKVAVVGITLFGLVSGIWLLYNPNLPSPTRIIELIFDPIRYLLE